ncbi:PASTA_pknB domain containing protein [uncultured Caudovirales phage]|uniref:PASTA_pknB domain containing protein n=1 Tax=uncultured Caudovirales phage TaxID=2100421 RepID=A0A6J5KPY1_9CAUD|nr:PASTA_pknB domain containing protein [uncultured Caudovirales phage]
MTVNPKDDLGNVQVDFVWGNFPLQPDEGRDTPLDAALDNHVIATTGYANFPSFLPNYAGDGDTDPEVVVPNLLRLARNAAQDAADAAGLGENNISYTNYDITNVTSTAKVVTITTDGDNLLAVGDTVSVVYNDGDGFAGTWADVKVTKIVDAGNFQFKLATAPDPALDFTSTGYVYNNAGIVLAQEPAAGEIVNQGTNVGILVLNGD